MESDEHEHSRTSLRPGSRLPLWIAIKPERGVIAWTRRPSGCSKRQRGRTIWAIDPVQSLVGFAVRHMMVSTFKGYFTSFAGVVTLDETDASRSRVEVAIDAASVDTHNAQRDTHLRSVDFLDVERHPKIIFESWGVELKAGERATVSGDLTIRGVTRLVILEVNLKRSSRLA